MTNFIQPLFPISLRLLPVAVARCAFQLAHYDDNLFDFYGITFPDALRHAAKSRRAEYLAGRWLAQRQLHRNGCGKAALLANEQGVPLWPPGVYGSISHTDKIALCATVASPKAADIGIDVENLIAPEEAEVLHPAILDAEEYRYLKGLPLAFHAALTLAFSAKESVYKALSSRHPMRDFHDIRLVALSSELRQFYCQVAGAVWRGEYLFEKGCVYTALYASPASQRE
ncbi:4'-phosphopantetheinyl transferase superfamily protein [Enterobacteriaceae bacterium H11S18]|uniref:4'-phosphopantetheinyl transferase family protein n=1 Tax=Dryocola clanedunensis TaxID=2925396 RepID=UPI0022F08635|nr:4'-phosphopantetheinyl transferase superfamily protein [Dryocola clanedunensis]MCT4712240.1 4'-phosphopantetheinyl transferase superfamily protein [Dryocola clanedunensis]